MDEHVVFSILTITLSRCFVLSPMLITLRVYREFSLELLAKFLEDLVDQLLSQKYVVAVQFVQSDRNVTDHRSKLSLVIHQHLLPMVAGGIIPQLDAFLVVLVTDEVGSFND